MGPRTLLPPSLVLVALAASACVDAEYVLRVPDARSDTDGGACSAAPPRPLAPGSTARVSTARPTVHVSGGAEGAVEVTFCRDRACQNPLGRALAHAGVARPDADLPAGPVFWRAAERTGSGGCPASPTWEFFVPARAASRDARTVDTSSGTVLDVNGDGLADVAAGGTNGFDDVVTPHQNTGMVEVRLGSAAGPGARATPALWPGNGVVEQFGASVASAGDVNGDGFGDLIVGAPMELSRAYVYFGGDGGVPARPSQTLDQFPGTRFGSVVAAAGDLDGDGYADVAVASPYADPAGRVWVYYGGPQGLGAPAEIAARDGALGLFGYALSAGDFDGDGRSELAIAAANARGTGVVYLYAPGPRGAFAAPAREFVPAMSSVQRFGYTMTLATDVNADGYADLIVGANDNGTDGRVYVFAGGASAPSTPAVVLATPTVWRNDVGATMASGDDVNADGYADLLVSDGGTASGTRAALLFLGGAAWFHSTPDATLANPEADSGRFAETLYLTGDVNGDGFGDAIVGDPGSATRSGRVYFYPGGATPPSAPAATLIGEGSAQLGVSLAALRRHSRHPAVRRTRAPGPRCCRRGAGAS